MRNGVVASLLVAGGLCAAPKPNMVVFLADDHGRADASVYGSPDARTPTMASLARDGMVFDNAFVASPACGPSRAALLSGLMPARNGAEANHDLPRPETQTMVKALQAAGYEVVAFGKIAHGQKHAELAGFDHWKDAHKEAIGELVRDYLANRPKGKPLCLMIGDHRPHVAWSKTSTYDPAQVTLPGYLIDTPETRAHWARYLTDITGMDALMGEVDALVRGYFGSVDHLFLYSADHGGQWPFGKWNLYDKGIHVPLIVRWPDRIKPGVRTKAMVSWIDLLPTLLECAGGTVPENIDGRSFAPVLLGQSDAHRDIIYTTHSGDGAMNVFPIRAVRTERFKYIRNLRPDCYHSNHSDILRKDGAGAYWDSWDEAAKTDPAARALIAKYYQRPPVELYDLEKDPQEQNNLAGNPEYKAQLDNMSAQLDAWMKAQGDTRQLFEKPYPLNGPTPHEVYATTESKKKKKGK